MTRAQAKRRRNRKRKMQRIAAWAGLYAAEILAAAVPTAVVSAVVLPLAYRSRGYYAVGSEWLMIILAFVVAYTVIHEWVCNKLFEEG